MSHVQRRQTLHDLASFPGSSGGTAQMAEAQEAGRRHRQSVCVEEQGRSDGSRQKENGSLCSEAGKDDCNSTPGVSAGECSASKQQNGEGTGVWAEGQGEEWRLLGDHRKKSKGRTDAGVSN